MDVIHMLLVNCCNEWCVCWITTILVCMSKVVWNPSRFLDYRDYGSLSLGIWSAQWLFLYLHSYNLVSSVTAGIRARFNTKHVICVFKISICENFKLILNVASGHILYVQLRTLRWLIKVLTWGVIVCFLFRCPYDVLLYGCHPFEWQCMDQNTSTL
jgi:hypothetical protein